MKPEYREFLSLIQSLAVGCENSVKTVIIAQTNVLYNFSLSDEPPKWLSRFLNIFYEFSKGEEELSQKEVALKQSTKFYLVSLTDRMLEGNWMFGLAQANDVLDKGIDTPKCLPIFSELQSDRLYEWLTKEIIHFQENMYNHYKQGSNSFNQFGAGDRIVNLSLDLLQQRLSLPEFLTDTSILNSIAFQRKDKFYTC